MVKVGAITYAQLIKHMFEGIYSCRELAEITGLHYVTVLEYTRALYRAGACHISSWEKDSRGRDTVKVYKLGPGKDAKRESLTPAERQAPPSGQEQAPGTFAKDRDVRKSLIERVGDRAVADSEGHWIWHGQLVNGKPVIWYKGRPMNVRRALAVYAGRDMTGREARCGCGVKQCVHPEHYVVVDVNA